jgi:hypothetical protein
MVISRRVVVGLVAFAAWTVFVWGTRIRNILGDDSRSVGFKVVHAALALISVGFAAWTLVALWRSRRTQPSAPETPRKDRLSV